ncbi:translation initiation factor IF-2 associated domain-containing protein, partial [Vibrio parahaemolyticus]|nr:translation initiation factor IF-2 associated domain-containing protein [Vibrio parahaemolyticus]
RMTDETVKSLAEEIQTPVERLVQQFADAGIKKTVSDSVSQKEKETLLAWLNRDKDVSTNQPEKLTLQRKVRSTLSVPGTGGKSKSVAIEVRKKRTYVNRDAVEKAQADEQAQREAEEKAHREAEEKAQREAQEKAQREAEEKAKREAEKAKKDAEEKAKREAEEAKREAAELAKREAAEKDKVKQNDKPKADKAADQEKARRIAEQAELKRKTEEAQRRKAEDEAKIAAEKARRLAEENAEKWTAEPKAPETEGSDYHVTTSRYARDAEDESDAEVEGGRGRGRNAKAPRPKKNNRHSEKADREEARAAGRTNKKGKRKGSSLQQGFNKPAAVVNRDVIIGETISVAE